MTLFKYYGILILDFTFIFGDITVDIQKAQMFLRAYKKYLPQDKHKIIEQKLLKTSDDNIAGILEVEFKNPGFVLIISIFLGFLGIDRFIIGDVKVGLIKLCTLGGVGILTIYDWINIKAKVKKINFNKIITVLEKEN